MRGADINRPLAGPTEHGIQLNDRGELCHFLTIEGLQRTTLCKILDTAEGFLGVNAQETRKVPLLRGINRRQFIF